MNTIFVLVILFTLCLIIWTDDWYGSDTKDYPLYLTKGAPMVANDYQYRS